MISWLSARYVLIALLTWLGARVSVAQTYTVKGDLIYSILDRTGVATYAARSHFTTSVSNHLWRVRMDFLEDTNGEHGNMEEAGFDGTNIFKVLTSMPEQVTKSNLLDSGSIGGGSFPSSLSPYSRVIWLATASVSFFSIAKQGKVAAPWLGPGSYPLMTYALTETLDSSNLPRTILFTTNVRTSPSGANQDRSGLLLTNFVTGRYSVLAFTNIGRAILPMEFELVRFFVPRVNSEVTNSSLPLNVFRGRITSVIGDIPSTLYPNVSRKTFVHDYRFRDSNTYVKEITYALTNGQWPDINDPRLLALFERRLKAAKANEPGKNLEGRSNPLITAIILALGILPFVLVFLMRNKVKQPQNKNTKT